MKKSTESSGGREVHPPLGKLFIVSAPSGAGKSTLCLAARQRIPGLRYSISYTTRATRPGEADGVDYHFISEDDFRKGIETDRWAEWARVHGHYYGTAADIIDAERKDGNDILMDIDVQGALQLTRRYPDCVTIFILPPSVAVLEERLSGRGTEAKGELARRIRTAEWEMSQQHRYDYVIVNDRLESALERLVAIIESHRSTGTRRGGEA